MSKKAGIIVVVVAVIALCLSAVNLCLTLIPSQQQTQQTQETTTLTETQENTQDVQYVLYLGTNDKDTNKPVFEPDEAKAKAEDIMIEHFGGYTIQEANGGWEDNGTRYQEYTLVIYLSDTTIEDVHAAAKDLIRVFNQSSVLIQQNQTTTEFYAGDN